MQQPEVSQATLMSRGAEHVAFPNQSEVGKVCSTGLASRAEEAAVNARGLQPLIAEHARAVGVGKRHHDHVAALDGAHVGADGLDHADRLVAHAAARLGGLELIVRPKIAPTNTGAGNTDERIGRMDDGGVWDVLDTDVAGDT
jgi:hypothetical protein